MFIGFTSTILYGYDRTLTKKEATQISFLTLGLFTCGLIIFAVEGLICIAMAAPIGLLLTWLGKLIGLSVLSSQSNKALTSVLLLTVSIPTTAFIEHNLVADVEPVVTKVVINASPEVIWKNIIEFPQLDPPTEILFKAGIAYPTSASIEGEGVGSVRRCRFNTGSFVEPVTVWNAPTLLRFDVLEQPEPLQELSIWNIDAPHLHNYFVSKRGQFKLTKLPNGKTELEGTTWYYHRIKPDFYWRLWSNWIIHNIHARVLNHIKSNAEKGRSTAADGPE